MTRKNAMTKPVRSFRISAEGVRQLRELSEDMGRSESEVIEVAVDRMYREEIRFGNLSVAEKTKPEDNYQVDLEEGK
jgi:DNA-binding PadR family transcriptional regulator